MEVTQEDFERACSVVVAVVTEHRADDLDGIHGALRALGLDPTSAIDVAENIASGGEAIEDVRERGGFAFITGLLVGIHLSRAADQRRGEDA